MSLSEQVFDSDQVLAGVIPVGDDRCRFDYKRLEAALKAILKERLGNENAIMEQEGKSACPTFVTATSGLHVDGPAKLFRSYHCERFSADQCCIWEAGRATTAAPSFFKAIFISKPIPGSWFLDGGMGHNNPSELALGEARRLFPTVRRFCLVSVGTGRQRSIKFMNITMSGSRSTNDDTNSQFLVNSAIPGIKTAKRLLRSAVGISSLKNIGEACVALCTSSEAVHQRLLDTANSANSDLRFPYHRFNVERDMENIGLHEWEKIIEMADHTRRYMTEVEGQIKREKCVRDLTNPSAVECK